MELHVAHCVAWAHVGLIRFPAPRRPRAIDAHQRRKHLHVPPPGPARMGRDPDAVQEQPGRELAQGVVPNEPHTSEGRLVGQHERVVVGCGMLEDEGHELGREREERGWWGA